MPETATAERPAATNLHAPRHIRLEAISRALAREDRAGIPWEGYLPQAEEILASIERVDEFFG